MFKQHKYLRATRKRRDVLAFETLEPRFALDAEGTISGADVHLTLSFAADGTSIAGQSNGLASLFDTIAPREVWQEKILMAFQTWAVHTNADIGVVSDGGQPFGSGGAIQSDSRFGDIRIGAIAMASNVAAVSVPVDGVVSGTWFADVIFNTAYNYQTIDDILAIAIHEAGNVFGLEDNADPNSPLHPGDPPVVREPTSTDIALLQQLHGVRAPDLNEISTENGNTTTNNDTITSSSQLSTNELNEFGQGSAPTIVYGDIGSSIDQDFFFIEPHSNYDGSVTVEVRTAGISLFQPRLKIYNQNQQLIAEGVSTNFGGDRLIVNLPSILEDQRYYFEVSSANEDTLNIGGYSLITTFDDENLATPQQIDQIAGGTYRFLPAEELAKFFDAEEDLYNDDDHTDDGEADAFELETAPGFVQDTRFEVIGSISDSIDADIYEVTAPEFDAAVTDVMTIAVRSLDNGRLIPRVTVLDENANVIPSTIIANGAGDYIVQVDGIVEEQNYLVKVDAANPGQLFDVGNYSLTVTFATDLVPFDSVGLSPLPSVGNGIAQNVHTLYVAKPQLFHFVMEAENVVVTSPTALLATIFDDQGNAVYQLSTRPGETRSREAVLLSSGTYTVRVVLVTLNGDPAPEIHYNFRWTAISDPFVGDPNDPTANPFACNEPGMEGYFCYPGEIITTDPTLWDAFVSSSGTPPTGSDSGDTLSALFGDWWTWVWDEFGVNGPVFANNDHYQTSGDTPLQVSGNLQSNMLSSLTVGNVGGLLSNDIDPEGQGFLALLETNVSHGTLVLHPDGGFSYEPFPGFEGMDSFTYRAYDFVNESNIGTVRIYVGNSGDYNADGVINGRDFLAWQRGFGRSVASTLTDGDGNLDGLVDAQDLLIWQEQYVDTSPSPSHGDSDGDGDVDGRDFLAWQRGYGISSGATASDGDGNADGAVNAEDLFIWQTSYESPTNIIATNTSDSLEPIASEVGLLSLNAEAETVALLANSLGFNFLKGTFISDLQFDSLSSPQGLLSISISSGTASDSMHLDPADRQISPTLQSLESFRLQEQIWGINFSAEMNNELLEVDVALEQMADEFGTHLEILF